MTYRNGNFPIAIGDLSVESIEVIAARCINRITGQRTVQKPKPYAVHLDRWGRVVVDRIADIVPDEWVMTCTRDTAVADLADDLTDAWQRQRPRHIVQAAA